MEINPVVTSVDPVTFEILSHRLYQIAREMGTALERVGGTVNTTQMHDYMASLYLANGDVLSAGDSAGWHVACAGFAVKRIIERFEKDAGINPNDIFLLNDPYLAAIHQSDVCMISPIHFKGKLMGWSAVSSLTRSVQGNKVEQEGPNRPQPQPLRLESKATAILVLDLSSRCENPKEVCFQLMERLGRFLVRARQSSVPILFPISAAAKGTPLGEVAEPLRRRQTEPVLYPDAFDKFMGGKLQDQLIQFGCRSLVIVGSATNFAVLYTATTVARIYRYEVVIPLDGVNAKRQCEHEYAIHQLTILLASAHKQFRFTTLGMMEFD